MKMANISDIQHFSIGDGEGIRTTIFFKGCNLNCKWCHNPETIHSQQEILQYTHREKKVGKTLTIFEVMYEVNEDLLFYKNSNGGVTLSGGEPLLQIDFLCELLQVLQDENLDTIIDTAGNVPFEILSKTFRYKPHFFYDIKANNALDYQNSCGGNFELIFENLKKIVQNELKVTVRIPIIPNFNDSKEYNETTAKLLANIGITAVHLLPFHRLGTSKYEALKKEYAYKNVLSLEKKDILYLESIYRREKINIKIEE